MVHKQTIPTKELPIIALKFETQCNGSVHLMGWIPEDLRCNIHAAMKNSRYDYRLPGTGNFILFIKETAGKTVDDVLPIIKRCIERLAKRADIQVTITT